MECYDNPFIPCWHCTVNTIHWVVFHTIYKATLKIFKFRRSLTLMRDNFQKSKELSSWRWFCNTKYFWLDNNCFKQLVDYGYSMTIAIQYFHIKLMTFDVLTFVYDIGISADSWNSPKIVSTKKFFWYVKRAKDLKDLAEGGRTHLTTFPPTLRPCLGLH